MGKRNPKNGQINGTFKCSITVTRREHCRAKGKSSFEQIAQFKI